MDPTPDLRVEGVANFRIKRGRGGVDFAALFRRGERQAQYRADGESGGTDADVADEIAAGKES
jgi:hypothetical protein